MTRILSFAILFFILPSLLNAQDTAYIKMITERSHKILLPLNITDSAKFLRVRKQVTEQYNNLNYIYNDRDTRLATVKKSGLPKDSVTALVKTIEEKTTHRTDSLHPLFLSGLAKELGDDQVTAIKDGMTYGVLPITYKGYQDMIPGLDASQKDQIMRWLVEAREHAMDAESSDKKHAWFGKYKGRINNYLSAAGIDLKKAGEDWEKRRNAARAVSGK